MAAIVAGCAVILMAGMSSATYRECNIEITNDSKFYTLQNPSVYIFSGSFSTPLPETIAPQEDVEVLFANTPYAARGSVGVFTYDLVSEDGSRDKMAVMFSVPFDYNLYSNWYGVGIFGEDTACDYDLFYKMYNNDQDTFVRATENGHSIRYVKDGLVIEATMTNIATPVIRIELSYDFNLAN